ncbi:hypothetical protein D3C78_1641300 [compost metagenome]
MNQHQYDAAQGLAIAMTFIVGRKIIVDQQLQAFALDNGQDFRHHFVNEILNRK